MTPAAYAPHADFVAPARGSATLIRLFAGILLIEVLFGLGLTVFGAILDGIDPELARSVFFGTTAGGLLLQLASFMLLAASIALVLNWQHRRSVVTALGPPGPAMAALWPVFGAVILLYLAIEFLPPWWSWDMLETRQSALAWVLTLPVALAALLIQTGAEEMFYRGYIQQQLAARFDRPWVWMLAPNLLFAAAHWDNGSTQAESWQYVIWALCFGLAASDLTARTGNLGAAIGIHLANNAYAFLIFAERGSPDSGLALFLMPSIPGGFAEPGAILSPVLAVDLAVVGLSWLAARIAIRR